MTCRKVVRQLPAYLADELSDRTCSRVKAHLKHCTLCTAELGALKRADQLLGTLPEIEPRRDLVGLVMQRIERERDTIPAFKRFLLSLRARQAQLRYATANVLLIVVLALTIVRLENNRRAYNQARMPAGLANAGGSETATAADRGSLVRRVRDDLMRVVAIRPRPIFRRLTSADIDAINRDMERERRGGDGVVLTTGYDGGPGEIIPVDASVILRSGPEGQLVITPNSAGTAAEQPTSRSAEEAGE